MSSAPVHVHAVLAMLGPEAVKSGSLESVAPIDDQFETQEVGSLLNLVGISDLITAGLGGMETEKLVAVEQADMEIGLGAVA